jgi:hypothetical protein
VYSHRIQSESESLNVNGKIILYVGFRMASLTLSFSHTVCFMLITAMTSRRHFSWGCAKIECSPIYVCASLEKGWQSGICAHCVCWSLICCRIGLCANSRWTRHSYVTVMLFTQLSHGWTNINLAVTFAIAI